MRPLFAIGRDCGYADRDHPFYKLSMPAPPKETQLQLDPLCIAVGQRVTTLREKRELRRGQLAKIAGMDPNYLWRIEAGRQNLSLRNVARLAKALDVTLSVLLEGIDVAELELSGRSYEKQSEQS